MNQNRQPIEAAGPPAIQARPGDDASSIGFFDGPSFNLAQRVAVVFAKSTLVPKHYQGNLGNCMIALNMAKRLGADPLMVMQNLYVVHGTPAWSAQFLIATFNMCGRFTALRYDFTGRKGADDYGCTAWAVEKDSGQRLEGSTITLSLAKKEGWYGKAGSKWQTMLEQMLMYRAASWFVRAYAPEIAMGLHTAEEMYDMGRAESAAFETGPAESAAVTAEDIEQQIIEAEPAPSEGEEAAPNTQTLTPATLQAIEKELTRLGVPGHLPPDIAAEYETGDPSELTEGQGRQTLIYLKNMKG